jgi:putative transposase
MRKPRQLRTDARYHVVAKANHREFLLDDPAKELFLAILARAKVKYRFSVENFTVLDNHFHLIVHVPEGSNLSEIMKWILGVFAMKWNKIHENWGHFWGERFFSRIIEDVADYVGSFAYIDQNPVRAGVAATTASWACGGLWHYLRGWKAILDPLPEWAKPLVWQTA